MKNNSISKIALVSLSLCTLVLLSAWAFLMYESGSLHTKIVEIALEAEDKSFESTYSSSVRNTLREAKADLSLIDQRFVEKDLVPEFINVLEQKGDASGAQVNLGSINVEPGAPYGLLKIRMTGSGTWEQMLSFVSVLDSLPYVLRIDNLSFTKRGIGTTGAQATTSWGFNLDIVQYVKETK